MVVTSTRFSPGVAPSALGGVGIGDSAKLPKLLPSLPNGSMYLKKVTQKEKNGLVREIYDLYWLDVRMGVVTLARPDTGEDVYEWGAIVWES